MAYSSQQVNSSVAMSVPLSRQASSSALLSHLEFLLGALSGLSSVKMLALVYPDAVSALLLATWLALALLAVVSALLSATRLALALLAVVSALLSAT